MTTWTAVLLSCALAYLLKLAGFVAPQRWFEHPRLAAILGLLPVALLAALVGVQTFAGDHGHLTLDARAAAVAVAVVALLLRANFLVVVILAALTAAGLRYLGWG